MTEMERPTHIFQTVRSRSSRSRDPHSVDNVSEKGSIHSSLSYSLWWSLVSHVISLFVSPSKSKRGEKRKRKQLGGGETQNRGPVSFLRMVEHVTNVDKTFPSSDDEDSIKVEGFFLVFLPHSRENKTSLIQEEASTTHFCGLFF